MKSSTLLRFLNIRTFGLLFFYTLVLVFSYSVAYAVRFDFSIPDTFREDLLNSVWWVVFLKLCLLGAFGQWDCLLAYFRLPDAVKLFTSLLLASIFLMILWFAYGGTPVPPRAAILTDFLISFLLLASFRIGMRLHASSDLSDWIAGEQAQSVIIVGAGEVGAELCSQLIHKSRLGLRPVAFLDDDQAKVGRFVHGVPVVDLVDELASAVKRYGVNKVVIAFPSASAKRVREVAEMAREAGASAEIVPALTDLVSGKAKTTQLRAVQLEDLLGRETIDLNSDKIASMLKGKRVVVTGAGGSIGRELIDQILSYNPSSLLCIDQAEIAVFDLESKLGRERLSLGRVQTRILDVLDKDALRGALSRFKPEVIFHAAAHKHVNLMEQYPSEALKNNFFATAGLVSLASELQVERFILISTDKAINPTSIMGASKRLAELALQEQQIAEGNQTKFMAVRFGNVLGSSGSVVPIFERQIELGGPLTVTHPEVTRFFMTVTEAVGLVLQSATQGLGGEIFVLDMGKSMKIIDVARQMIALSGLKEEDDIEIEITGLRPGEKLFEEVQHVSESLRPTEHERVLSFVAHAGQGPTVVEMISELRELLHKGCSSEIKEKVKKYIPEYNPSLDG